MSKNKIQCAIASTLAVATLFCLHSQWSRAEEVRPLRISCVNNLKMIDIALRIWAGDHGEQYPWNVSTNAGGTKELCVPDKNGFDTNSFRDFQVMSNVLNSPLVLVCPSDPKKKPAASFADLAPSNVTYRIHIIPGVTPDNAATNKAPFVVCPIDGSTLYYDGNLKGNEPEQDANGRHPMKAQ